MDVFYGYMVVVRISKPVVTTATDKAEKPAAYGYGAKPTAAPTYPVTVAQVSGKGKYRVVLTGVVAPSTYTLNVAVASPSPASTTL